MTASNPPPSDSDVPPRADTPQENDSQSSPGTSIKGSDRVYPLRSVLLKRMSDSHSYPRAHSALPSAASPNDTHSLSESTKPYLNSERSDTIDSALSDDQSSADPAASAEPDSYVTFRHEHMLTEKGHSVIIGKDKKTLQRCEDEPIRTPGAIQSFGVMVALREESPNQFVVRVVSENSEQVLGYSPEELFELDSFSEILEDTEASKLEDHLDYVRDDAYDIDADGPEVFLVSISSPDGDFNRFWCAAHVSQENKDIIICEFELEDDEINPLNVEDEKNMGFSMSKTPITTDTLGINPSPSQLAESTKSSSKSVRSIRNARQRKGEAAAMQIFNTLTPIQEQLGQANDQETLLEVTAGLVKELVGFHRVLIYQFDSSWNGKVVSELVDPSVTIDLYKGLHFPASDIPSQARELYKVNKVRLLYDRDHTTSRLVCRTVDDLETPVDMTHAYLRAMSPIHTQYLANMKVRSSMSISINAFGNLWGLISCHSYGDRGMRVSFPLRRLCRLVGDTVARGIERISYASSLQTRKLMDAIPQHTNPSSYIAASSDELLQFLEADYGALSIGGESKFFGGRSSPTDHGLQEARALVDYLRQRQVTSVLSSHDVVKDFPDFHLVRKLKIISGLLCVPLSTSTDQFLVFFRRGQLTTITWAGNPHEIAKRKQVGSRKNLTPRESFKEWVETTLTKSREWSETDITTATNFGLVYGKFIQVWSQKDSIGKNSRLNHLLLANSAHEVRTPLNAVINYLEIALEGTLDEQTRESLLKSHSASKSLIYTVNDLLDLTNMSEEASKRLIKDEPFDLKSTFRGATSMLAGEAERKGITYTSAIHPDLPVAVMGDQRRIRQVCLNLVANAIQHTQAGSVHAEISPTVLENAIDGYAAVEMVVSDTGSGISTAKLDTLFGELEQMSDAEINSIENREDLKARTPAEPQEGVLGLGLALAARMANTMHGQLSVKSEEGKGSRFRITLQFRRVEETLPILHVSHHDDVNMPKLSRDSETVGNSSDGRIIGGDDIPAMAEETELVTLNSSEQSQPAKAETTTQKPSPDEDAAFNNADRGSQTQSEGRKSSGDSLPSSNTNSKSGNTPSSRPRKGRGSSYNTTDPQTTTTPSEGSSSMFSPSNESSTEPSNHSSGRAKLRILVAEDDPINSTVMKKRLENSGHIVELTYTGDACVHAFSSDPKAFDVILMDIQMPIIDGIGAAKMIRELENKSASTPPLDGVKRNGIPIIAVSASIVEQEKISYIEAGFDGWMMKPIDFARLNMLLARVRDPHVQTHNEGHRLKHWESGEWFDIFKTAAALAHMDGGIPLQIVDCNRNQGANFPAWHTSEWPPTDFRPLASDQTAQH